MELSKELQPAVETARRMILEEGVPCVFLRDGAVAGVGEGTGVRPLIDTYDRRPELLRGAVVVDRIVGKAAAMLAVLGGAAGIYGLTISEAARDYLAVRGIPCGYDDCIARIINRAGTGLCPMEQAVLTEEDPAAGLATLRETMRRLQAK
jgi:hypothetical protein